MRRRAFARICIRATMIYNFRVPFFRRSRRSPSCSTAAAFNEMSRGHEKRGQALAQESNESFAPTEVGRYAHARKKSVHTAADGASPRPLHWMPPLPSSAPDLQGGDLDGLTSSEWPRATQVVAGASDRLRWLHRYVGRFANLSCRKVRTGWRNVPQSRVRCDQSRVAVVAQIHRPAQRAGPVSEKVNCDAHGRGSQNRIRPDDLRPWSGMAVPADLLRKIPLVQEAEASETGASRHRQHHLSPHSGPFTRYRQHAESDVDIGNQESPRTDFELAPILKGVQATEDHVAASQSAGIVLPPHAPCRDGSPVLEALHQPLRDVNLGTLFLGICRSRPDKTIQIRFFYAVGIVKHEVAEPDVCQVLDYVRATTSEADDAGTHASDNLFRV